MLSRIDRAQRVLSRFWMTRNGLRFMHTSYILHENEISNIAYDDFLVAEVDYGKNIIDEACSKHPLNPKDVPRQKPGEDLAPIPVVNDTKLSKGAMDLQDSRNRSALHHVPPPQAAAVAAKAASIERKVVPAPANSKKPVSAINQARSEEMQQQAALSDDKKYKCHLCSKMFRALLALKSHMVIRHDGAEVQLPAEDAVPAKESKSQDSQAKTEPLKQPISLSKVQTSNAYLEPGESASIRASLLEQWDKLGKQKWGDDYKFCRIYTEEEIRTLADNIAQNKESPRTAQESGIRERNVVEPKPIATSIPEPGSVSETNISAEKTSGASSLPHGTFNPFASLKADDGTIAPIFDTSASTVASPPAPATENSKPQVEISVDGEKRFQCTICGKAFKTQIGLTGHFETKHPGQATGVTTAGSITEGGKYAVPVNLEDIPAYVPTPVDMSKFPGQGTGDVDPKGVALAEELRSTTLSLEQDVVVHARACTNISLSGIVVEMQSGYQGLIPVLQFSLLVENEASMSPAEQEERKTDARVGTETFVIRVYGSAQVKRAQASIREGNLVLVIGLVKLNPVALNSRTYNNPYITVSDGGGTVIPLA